MNRKELKPPACNLNCVNICGIKRGFFLLPCRFSLLDLKRANSFEER